MHGLSMIIHLKEVTFKELDDFVKKIANGLLSLGLEKGMGIYPFTEFYRIFGFFFACGRLV